MDEKPTIDELTARADVGVKWHRVGVQLKLGVKKLNSIDQYPRDDTYKLTQMYQLWLDSTPNATRRQLVEILKMPVIGENALAKEYEDWISTHVTPVAATERLVLCTAAPDNLQLVSPAITQRSTIQELVMRDNSYQLCALLSVDDNTRTSLASNLTSAGIISTERAVTVPELLLQEVQAFLQHSPYRFTDVLEEMNKVQALQGTVINLQQAFMGYISQALDVTNTQAQQPLCLPVSADNDKLMTFRDKAEGQTDFYETVQKYRDLEEKFHQLFLQAQSAIESVDPKQVKFYIFFLLIGYPPELGRAYMDDLATYHSEFPIGSASLLFLTKNGLLTLWNYGMLQYIVSCLLASDESLKLSMREYDQAYKVFYGENLDQLQKVFHQENVKSPQPKVPASLREFRFKLRDPWPKRSAQKWRERYRCFPWSRHTVLKNFVPGCITIVYAALPCVTAAVMRDLTDPVIVADLESIGVSVVLPQEDFETIGQSADFETVLNTPISLGSVDVTEHETSSRIISEVNQRSSVSEEVEPVKSKDKPSDKPLSFNEQLNKPLMNAIESCNVTEVVSLLKQGADPNCVTPGDTASTPLHIAARKGYADVVEALLDHGANPNSVDMYGRTPLFEATKLETVNLLLAHNARTDTVDKDSKTLLHHAIECERSDIVQLLVTKCNIDLNAVDKDNNTPLKYAAKIRLKRPEIINILLTHGAYDQRLEHLIKTLQTGKFSPTQLIDAVRSGNVKDVIRLLQLGISPHLTSRDGTLLHIAAQKGNTDIGEELLNRGVKPNILNESLDTALHIAVRHKNKSFAELLLTRGADPNATGFLKKTPIFNARNTEIIRMLIAHGARSDVFDGAGKTLLHYAIERDEDVIEFLIDECGLDVDAVDKDGQTCFHYAAKYGSNATVMLFIAKCKTDVNARSKYNKTPIFHIMENEHGDVEMFDTLIAHGARTDLVDESGKNLLHWAAMSGKDAIVPLLITKFMINVNDVDKKGNSALHYSVIKDLGSYRVTAEQLDVQSVHVHGSDRKSVTEILLSHGTDPNIVNKDGETALHVAVVDDIGTPFRHGYNQMSYFIKMLLQAGANPDIRNKEGRTPSEIIELLELIPTYDWTHNLVSLLKEYSTSSETPRHHREETALTGELQRSHRKPKPACNIS